MWEFFSIGATLFTTKEQQKQLTLMLCFLISCYKLYKEGVFFYVLTLKYKCHLGKNSKKLNLKNKT
jgi:hypothetical protein